MSKISYEPALRYHIFYTVLLRANAEKTCTSRQTQPTANRKVWVDFWSSKTKICLSDTWYEVLKYSYSPLRLSDNQPDRPPAACLQPCPSWSTQSKKLFWCPENYSTRLHSFLPPWLSRLLLLFPLPAVHKERTWKSRPSLVPRLNWGTEGSGSRYFSCLLRTCNSASLSGLFHLFSPHAVWPFHCVAGAVSTHHHLYPGFFFMNLRQSALDAGKW